MAAVVAAAYAIQFRPESLLILPVVGFLAWPRIRQELARPRAWWAAILFLWLGAMHVGHLYAVRHIGWGTDAARFSLDYIATNLPVNGWFYLYDERFPFAFTLLAMVGLLAGPFRRERASMAIYFLAFFAIGLVFYAGSYNYGADVRYSLDDVSACRRPRRTRGLAARAQYLPIGPGCSRPRPDRDAPRKPVPLVRPGGTRDDRGRRGPPAPTWPSRRHSRGSFLLIRTC